MQVKKQQLELDMEQQIGSKLGNEYIKAVNCDLAYLTYMESILYKIIYIMEQQIGSKLGNEYVKAIYCHPVYLTYMQSTS